MTWAVRQGDCRELLRAMPAESVHCVVTSPPYWGLRDYGLPPLIWGRSQVGCIPRREHAWGEEQIGKAQRQRNGEASGLHGDRQTNKLEAIISLEQSQGQFCRHCHAWKGSLGLEPTPELYIAHMVEVFREVKRVLRKDGTLFVNMGDSYASNGACGGGSPMDNRTYGTGGGTPAGRATDRTAQEKMGRRVPPGLKPKDLCGMPWRLAFALQADGWWLRSEIIWCLSGGTWLYVRSQKGDMPMMLRDAARLDPSTVQLWDGNRWAQVESWTRAKRHGDELELVLRSGERIACTPTHRFPTERGLVAAGALVVGDQLCRADLPEPRFPRDCAIDENAAWFAGLYIAEGSMADDTIQLSGHAKEEARWDRVRAIAERFGGSATRTIDGNKMSIRVYGKVLRAILGELVTGRTAKDKGFAPVVWRYSNRFITAMVEGYLSGDGHWDSGNQRWRLGFTRNYNLERDLRTACARLGWHLVLKLASVPYDEKDVPTFRGELRRFRSGHGNEKQSTEIVAIRKARCRYVYDVAVEGDPHLFTLASGILTHNSKPNPMPESVRDRPTKAHETVFLLTRSPRYFYDQEAVREPAEYGRRDWTYQKSGWNWCDVTPKRETNSVTGGNPSAGRNRRTVWTIPTAAFPGAHFATFPPKLIEPMILTSPTKCCAVCGQGWERELSERKPPSNDTRTHGKHTPVSAKKLSGQAMQDWLDANPRTTLGFRPACDCGSEGPTVVGTVPAVVLDIFCGSGTTPMVALRHGRSAIGLELSEEYAEMARRRIVDDAPLFNHDGGMR